MLNSNLVGPWIRRFLLEHIVGERNLARNTQTSYRDTLSLLLPFVTEKVRRAVDQLEVEQISADQIRAFLLHLEQQRHCSVSTRNQRLAAIHALARFISQHSPEHIEWCMQICAVPFKRTSKPALPYLEKSEMDALRNAPDRRTKLGERDYALLLFLYNTGARADEAAHIKVADLDLHHSPSVKIVGKGSKTRICPLWPLTVKTMTSLTSGGASSENVFLNRYGEPLTRFGIHALVKRYVAKASPQWPSLRTKKISTHTVRHTSAVHLLRSGVDINTIRAWLGHVSLETTNIYAEADLEMKAKALAHCEIRSSTRAGKAWHNNRGLMTFLKSL